MSEIAATLGLPVIFHFGDRDYQVAARTFEVEGLFSVWLESQALQAIQRHREILGPAGVAMQMDGWRRDCAGHAYDWDSLECWQARGSVPGRKYLASLQLCKGGITLMEARDLVERVWEDVEVAKTLEETMERANTDPNRARPYRRA